MTNTRSAPAHTHGLAVCLFYDMPGVAFLLLAVLVQQLWLFLLVGDWRGDGRSKRAVGGREHCRTAMCDGQNGGSDRIG